METVAFYSYKGGVGRSLLLANAARFLATLGKGVVALDFDFEAPGLHYKLGSAQRSDTTEIGGAVPYLNATAESAAHPPSLAVHMMEIPVPPGADGWLRLMPAGPAPHKSYWAAFKELGEKLRLGDPSGQGFMALLDLQARIADELKPDYLLIDARTGVTELGGLATTILADTVVCMFVGNQESLDGTLTVVEALKSASRLANQEAVRVVPVLSRTASEPPRDERFSNGVKRLLELGEGKTTNNRRELFALPHDAVLGASERVVGGERKASAFSPLYKAYLELFGTLFPTRAEPARQVLERLESVASIREELERERYEYHGRFPPWESSSIEEGVLFKPKRGGVKENRYADLLCRGEHGEPLMAVEYIGAGSPNEALEFWSKGTEIRCLVLLPRARYERKILTRENEYAELRPVENRWDLPGPRDFELLRDVGDRSVESMLDALGHGHVEAVAWLVNEWRESSGMFDERHMKRGRGHWQPERAQRILDGLAATEDQDCAEEILRRARGHEPWRGRHPFREEWESSEEMEQKMAEDLFAPLFWRLPVEAVVKSMDRRYPGDTGPLVGYRLLAHHLMGLRYDPERSALEEARALADRLPGSDDHGDEGDERILRWLHRSAWERSKRVHFSEEPPPALLWEEMLREESYWRRELEEAGLKAREKVKKLLESRGSLRRRLKEIAARRELVMQGLLCDYEASGRIELYPQVISAAAEVLGISPRHLKSVVFIHVCTWAMASEAFDLDGQRGYGFIPPPRTGPVARESPTNVALVQAFTDRLIRTLRDANLEAASEELSKHQPPAYTRWAELGKLPLEKLRQLLLAARASAAALDLPSGDTQ